MSLAALILVAAPVAALAQAPPPPATFTVDSTDDAVDASTGDPACATAPPVRCTLRAAIQQANFSGPSADTIILPAGTYSLTLTGAENSAANGDLDITDGVTLDGAGANAATVTQTVAGEAVFDARSVGANPTIEIEGTKITGGKAAGIRSEVSTVRLTLTSSAVVANTNTGSQGGGIFASFAADLTLTRTEVSGNSASSGGGLLVGNGGGSFPATITNSTISGNNATAGGGGGLVTATPTSGGQPVNLINTTVTSNTASGSGGGLSPSFIIPINVRNTIVAGNSATGGGANCSAAVGSLGNNIENLNTCILNQSTDKPNTDPQLGALGNSGGTTQTHDLAETSPAIDAVSGCPAPTPTTDQRGIDRPLGAACDIGAVEFAAETVPLPSLPDCSQSGVFTLQMQTQAGQHPTAFHYRVDGGPTQSVATTDKTEPINLAEGRYQLEYWSETQEAGQTPGASHLTGTALVDQTDPTVSVQSDQGQSLYVIKRDASVTVQAADPLSGLTVNPAGADQEVSTASRGQKSVAWTAEDLCRNQATAQFDYTVLGPGIGERAVIEPLGEGVKVQVDAGTTARASGKGTAFEPVTQPREIPVGSTIDSTGGKVRITSSTSGTEGDIQDGQFQGGVFQVLQSRAASGGLTRLRLKGSAADFDSCPGATAGARASGGKRRRIRRLRGNATGRYRTRGKHSAATVRGTIWTVTDRCDGTLTRVTRGSVSVRDFRLKKTIVVREGKSYLAQSKAAAEPEPPKLGKTVTVDEVKGKVFVRLPAGSSAHASGGGGGGGKGTGFVPLSVARTIPVRSLVDTRLGTVKLSSARNKTGKTQSGQFNGGVFQVLQSRKQKTRGITELRMKGSIAKHCGGGNLGPKGQPLANASRKRRTIRRLRGRAKGRYRTRGRHSAATVRGTVWTVTDRCDGTMTRVKRGKVTVRDFRLHKTIVLKRGKRYLANAR